MQRERKGKHMIVTDPEHGTREWSEDPVGDLMEMRQIIIDSFEKITEDVKRFCEGLDDLTHTLLPPEKPGWAIHNKRRYRPRRIQPKLHLNTVPLGTATYLYKAKEMKNLARSTKTHSTNPEKGHNKKEQCKHTFEITRPNCAPCAGYNVNCKQYEGNGAADTKHHPRRNT